MKNRLTLTVLAAALALGGVAFAQNAPGKSEPFGNQQRQTRGLKGGGPQQDADHQAMVAAAKDLNAAQRLMKRALPIYRGHRHRAMETDKIALRVLKLAYTWRPSAPNKPINVQQELARIGDGGEVPASRYTDSQVAASDALMRKALGFLLAARNDLSKVRGTYDGYVATTAQLVGISISEVQAALQKRP